MTNNTDGAALLPVTPEEEAFAELAQLLANHRQLHSLPATQEDAERSGVGSVDARQEIADALHKAACGMLPTEAVGPLDDERSFWLSLADAALSTPQRQEYDGEAVREALADHFPTGLRSGYARTAGGIPVQGGGIEIDCRCGWSTNATDEHEARQQWAGHVRAAIAHPAQATPSATVSDATKRMEQTLGATFQATPSAVSGEPVQKLHELPRSNFTLHRDTPVGHRPCRHCDGKDDHCSVCEGVGYLPSHQGAE